MLLNPEFPEQGDVAYKERYKKLVDDLCNSCFPDGRDKKEREYLSMAFKNAWHQKRPWNTKTSTEKIKIVGEPTAVVVICLGLTAFLMALDHHLYR